MLTKLLTTPFVLQTLIDSELRSRRNQTFDGPVITFINNTGKTSVNVMVQAQYCAPSRIDEQEQAEERCERESWVGDAPRIATTQLDETSLIYKTVPTCAYMLRQNPINWILNFASCVPFNFLFCAKWIIECKNQRVQIKLDSKLDFN